MNNFQTFLVPGTIQTQNNPSTKFGRLWHEHTLQKIGLICQANNNDNIVSCSTTSIPPSKKFNNNVISVGMSLS